ncbi:MAG: SUMF1/EgtB/PvdO family nonheme iron enzyme, partial [Nitrospinota bacterium]|nr:SUMF1/EgtB/PvdO family nonheme iron enzyme [Nitrospinota bacterium]
IKPVDRTYNTHRSPYGAVDMAGNVGEWVQDWHAKDYYRNAPERNPQGPASGSGRVVRGGSWGDGNPTDFRAAFRYWNLPDFTYFIHVRGRWLQTSRAAANAGPSDPIS